MARGYLLLVLHCHLPYVRHPEHEDFLEEDWLYEAVAETYLPLLHVLEGLEADEVPFRVTLSFSPTLCEMLTNELLRRRCVRYLDRHVELARREVERTAGSPFEAAARMYAERYGAVRATFVERCGGDLLSPFAALARRGRAELIGSAATHAILPLVATPQARHAQVAAGLRNHEKHFGGRPAGFWLPECGYADGLDELLAEQGVGFFFLDTHGVLLARPAPRAGVFAPLRTPAGPFAFGRDVESSRQVWSAEEGYPGDAAYREFHRDLGHDADLDYLRPCLHADGARRPLGIKYHRVTGDVPLHEKEPYRPDEAAARAAQHARHFVAQRAAQAGRVRAAAGVEPVMVCPYDAELFGHWWFEGPQFLDAVLRGVARHPDLDCVTGSDALRRAGEGAVAGRPADSSWGDGGYFEPWVNGTNDWIYPRLHQAETRMAGAAAGRASAGDLEGRALDQCARVLMLAQSSDWPFLMYTATARDYAARRFTDLVDRFDDLMAQLEAGRLDSDVLAHYEWLDDPFPEMDARFFAHGEALQGRMKRMR